MADDTKLGFVISNVARAAARDEQVEVDFAVQNALLQFGKGRLAHRDVDVDSRGSDGEGLDFGSDVTDHDLF